MRFHERFHMRPPGAHVASPGRTGHTRSPTVTRRLSLPSLALVALACGSCQAIANAQDPDTAAMPPNVGVVVVESDFQSAAIEAIDTDTHALVTNTGLFVDSDPELRRVLDPAGAEHLYILGRSGGTLTEIDRAGHVQRTMSVVDPGAAASSADPYDVAYAPDGTLWITRYNQPTLLVLGTDGSQLGTVDLSALADPDGRPEMAAITIVDGMAYVALDRLAPGVNGNPPAPTDYSSIAAIDTRTKPWKAVESQRLPAFTPRERFRHAIYGPPNEFFISCLGAPMSTPPIPGALVKIDVTGHVAPRVVLDGSQLMLNGKATRGFVNGYDVLDDERGWAVIASIDDPNNTTSVVEFNPTTGDIVTNVWYSRSKFYLWDLALADDRLLVVDRDPVDPTLVVLDASDGSVITPNIPSRLPAVEMVILRSQ